MKKLALALAATGMLALAVPAAPALASIETYEAKAEAADAAAVARMDMEMAFDGKRPKIGQFLWRNVEAHGEPRVVVSLSDQLAYLYRGDTLIAVSTVSTGTEKNPTPTGIFSVLDKKPMHRSIKYDNAPMPFMQRIDKYGIALHAGHLPGYPASHGCIRLPSAFAKKLYGVTSMGSAVLIGA
ncbi:MAG TPA: L,D-transpeptidase family protein [Sphingomicrobium sp.]|nr:L,D-transpeptidase family protein [Sphingomicrobium sp.]